MNGLLRNVKRTAHHAKVLCKRPVINGVALFALLPAMANAVSYPGCILPVNQVAIESGMNTEHVRDCVQFHLEKEFSASANFFEMSSDSVKSNVESGTANIAIFGAQEASSLPTTIEIVVTATGIPEPDNMTLSRGDSFNELAMVAGVYTDGSFSYEQKMGDSESVSMLSRLNFAASAMADKQMPQHFHLVQIACD